MAEDTLPYRRNTLLLAAIGAISVLSPVTADAAEIKVLTAGAMKAVVIALQPGFEAASGHKLVIDNDTAGGLAKRIGGGETFDVGIITPGVVDDLSKSGKMVAGSRAVTLLPDLALSVENRGEQLEIRPFSAPVPFRTLVLVWRPRSPFADAFRRTAATLRAARA